MQGRRHRSREFRARDRAPHEDGQRRDAARGGTAGGITHDSQTEGYYIVSGGGAMFTDGYIVNGRHNLSPELNGPTCSGMACDVVKKVVKPGDIIIIPAGVVHGWLDIGEHVDHLSFRPAGNSHGRRGAPCFEEIAGRGGEDRANVRNSGASSVARCSVPC